MSKRMRWILGFVLVVLIAGTLYLAYLVRQGVRGYGVLAQELEPTQTPNPHLGIGSEYLSEMDGMKMVFVPSGDFLLGTNNGNRDEKPEHIVYLDAYWIDKTEVTNRMYILCVKSGSCLPPKQSTSITRDHYFGNPEFADHPVIYVNWDQAKSYCEWAGRRLPTEAEWEKAARGDNGNEFPWGDATPDKSLLNFAGIIGDTTQVGSYPAGSSLYGVLDMTGNVLEWVSDCYGSRYYQSSPRQNPTGPSGCEHEHRVIRGGTSWDMHPHDWEGAADRMNNLENESSAYVGFRCAHKPSKLDLEKLFIDVFAPQSGEKVLLMVDSPHDELPDNGSWADRRAMAEDWHAIISNLGHELGFDVYPILIYPATGAHNGELPKAGKMEGENISFEDMLEGTNILLAMTEYSATAPLMKFTEKYKQLRVASMPMVSRSMEQTALAANYSEVARRARVLADKLDNATRAMITFSTGHELLIDLRFRSAEVDGGQIRPGQNGARVINLPSGEAYIAPYEGEMSGVSSLTSGTVPLTCGKELTLIRVQENRIVDVSGEMDCVNDVLDFIEIDEMRRNIAELGLGVNDSAVISGNVLEDEKVWGVHLAAGRSDHIGGVVGVEDFSYPNHVVHRDVVFPFGGQIEVTNLVLVYEDGTEEAIIADRAYTMFER